MRRPAMKDLDHLTKDPCRSPKEKGKSPRQRRRGGRCHAPKEKNFHSQRRITSDWDTAPGFAYKPRPLTENDRVFRQKRSKRWYKCEDSPTASWDVPYIDKLGRFSGHTFARWSCEPRQIVASCTSTILHRIERYAAKHNKYNVVKRNLPRLVRLSYLYACTKNNYMWDRVLFFSRNLEANGRNLHGIFLKYFSLSNASVRFVCSHVTHQTKWLLSRAERPRDKLDHFRFSPSDFSKEKFSGESINRFNAIYNIAVAMTSITFTG